MKLRKIVAPILCLLAFKNNYFSQDKLVDLKEVTVLGKKSVFKEIELYEFTDTLDDANIDGFYALKLFTETLSNEIWFTTDKKCIEVNLDKLNFSSGKSALSIKWDKISGGCNWIGMGFGWNAWQGKDISTVVNKAAIQCYVKSKGDTLKSLPLALALEDYSGVQAYTGFSPSFIQGGKITSSWTKVIIPFSSFPFVKTDLDISNIKQFIIQFEAAGDLFFDDITIIPFEGNLKPKLKATKVLNAINIDGNVNEEEWGIASAMVDEKNKLFVRYDDTHLYIAAQVIDLHPFNNKFDDSEIWNGDAIEFSIGMNPEADINRTRYLLSDYQIGIKCVENAYVWNWKTKSRIVSAEVKTLLTDSGYNLEAKIPLVALGNFKIEAGKKYGFEFALDNGDTTGKRIKQDRWASSHQEGFNLDPSLWGIMIIN